MNPDGIITSLSTTGVGGLLAAWMFYWYRQDRILTEKMLQTTIEQFTKIIDDNTRAMTALTESIRSAPCSSREGDGDHTRFHRER